MTTRTLELNLRAKADTRDIERLGRETDQLAAALRRSSTAFDEANADARKLAQTFGQLSQEEREQIQSASQVAAAVSRAAEARERAAAAASNAASAESRALASQQQVEQAALRTAAAEETLAAKRAGTAASVSRASAAEEKLAQERQKTFQSTAKSEKAELDVARAREQLRVATVRAEQAEKRIGETRKSTGLATDIVRKQLQALIAGGVALEAGRHLLQFGRDSVMAASDAEEASAKFDQVFRDLSSGVRDELEQMADVNRRSVYDLVNFASTLQDTFVPLGFAREEAAALSTSIVQLGTDIAAFSNKSDADVIQNLTSAIVGNHEAVRSYGIVLTETVLKQELARIGALELTGAALEVAKAQARVNIIMRASADAQGAAVREADSYANTLKAWDAAILDLKVSLGESLLPMMTQLASAAITIADALNDDYVRGLLAAEEANRKHGASAEDLTNDLKDVITQVRESDNWFARLKLSQGNLGNSKGIKDLLAQIALGSESVEEFESHFKDLGLQATYLVEEGGMWDLGESVEDLARQFYESAQAAPVLEQALSDLLEMQEAYQRKREEIATAGLTMQTEDVAPAWLDTAQTQAAMDAMLVWTAELGNLEYATQQAAIAQKEFNIAFGESFANAPVDDLIQAQQDLQDATGVWKKTTIDNSGDMAVIQAQLAADLTADQKSELQKQLKDLDSFSAEYLAIVARLEGDLSDSQRFDLTQQLAALEGRQGQSTRAYTGDVEAAEEARAAIIAANQAIQDSYYERAYNSIAARLIEEGNFEQLAGIAVGLGIMTQEEADLRLEYAQTTAALDVLTQSTAFYGLTTGQQVGAIRSMAAGVYETAAAAIAAQNALKATQDFYNSAPDSYQIGQYYQNLADQAAPEEGITTTVSVAIDPTTEMEFRGYRGELEEYDAAVYETTVIADSRDANRDFESMATALKDLTRDTWVINVRYETQGQAPTAGEIDTDGIPGNGRSIGGGKTTRGGNYVDLVVNNYGGGDVGGAVKTGVLAALRSIR